MNILKERSYGKEIEGLFTEFFELHPTKDLNTLFSILKKERKWRISTSKVTVLENIRLSENMELSLCLRTNEIRGNYTFDQNKCYKVREAAEENERGEVQEELRNYPIVLTADGIRVKGDTEIDEIDRARIEQFKFLIQLIDLSEESREGLVVEYANISEGKSFKRDGSHFSYKLGYKSGNDHEIIEVIKKHFDIDSSNQENTNNQIAFTGRCFIDNSDGGFTLDTQNHSVQLIFGKYGEVGTVQVSGSVAFY